MKIIKLKQSHHSADIWTFQVQVGPWRVAGFRYNALTRGLIPACIKLANGHYFELIWTASPRHWKYLRDLIECMIALGMQNYDPQSPEHIEKLLERMSRRRLQKLVDQRDGDAAEHDLEDEDSTSEHNNEEDGESAIDADGHDFGGTIVESADAPPMGLGQENDGKPAPAN